MDIRKKKYKIIQKGFFQSIQKFEESLNHYAKQGWQAVNTTLSKSNMYALIEKPS